MAWECTCGISNHDETFRCAGCGWTREQGKQDGFDGESKQSVEDIKTDRKYKWEKYILSMVILVFVMPGIQIADLPIALTVFIQLVLFIILFSLI
jgi:hypothetical protein